MTGAVLRNYALVAAASFAALTPSSAMAQSLVADKSAYTLFNPTPANLLRDFTTDRPDTTESPFTVDAGHVLFETGLFGFTKSRPDSAGTVNKSYEYGTTNLRIGLTNMIELDLIYAPYGVEKFSSLDPTARGRFSGSGDLNIRAKFNLWGNDKFNNPGDTAFGLLPFVTVPTDKGNGVSSDFYQGGIIFPFAIKLSEKFDLGLNGGVQWIHNEDTPGYHKEYLATASLGYEWSEKVSTYYELATVFATSQGDAVQVGTGITYKLNKNIQLDAGVNIGVTSAAPRVNPFIGVSARF